MPFCEFWQKKKCQSYGTWREDEGRYLCETHYHWHKRNTERLTKGINDALRKIQKLESKRQQVKSVK